MKNGRRSTIIFAAMVWASALAIEALGTTMSVIGFSRIFGMSALVVAMAIAMDTGKVMLTSFAYRYWRPAGIGMRTVMVTSVMGTMLLTSWSAYAYLTGRYSATMINTEETQARIATLNQELDRDLARKAQIDHQVAALPPDFIHGRVALNSSFAAEAQALRSRIYREQQNLATLKVDLIQVQAKVGPIIATAKAFGTTTDVASKWFVLMMVTLLDPVALVLLIAGNYLLTSCTPAALKRRDTGRERQPNAPTRTKARKARTTAFKKPANVLQLQAASAGD